MSKKKMIFQAKSHRESQHTLANFWGIWYINEQERLYICSNLQSPAKDRQCK